MRFLTYVLVGVVFFCAHSVASAQGGAKKPNILLIYADDLGYGELGCQGEKTIPTPHIDSIAKKGVRFTSGYVASPYCAPSRAGLMTGKFPTRFGFEFNPVAKESDEGLPLSEMTMADRLRALGYATCIIGKWHLGNSAAMLPTKRGFQEFYGTPENTAFFTPKRFFDTRLSPKMFAVEDPKFYTTDAYADRAVDWLDKNKGSPWFLYLPFNAQHAPLQAPQKYLDRFPTIQDKKRQTFAAMMSAMDDAIGRVLAKIHDLGQDENTIVVFISDNGGPTQQTTSSNAPLRGFKMTLWEGGVRVPFLMKWPGHIPAGKTYDFPVVQLDMVPTFLAAAGSPIDAKAKLDGVDLLPFLTGAKKDRPHQTLYWRFSPQWAIRHGDLKLVLAPGGSGKPELYDLAKDIGEKKNIAAENAKTVGMMEGLYKAWNDAQPAPLWIRKEHMKSVDPTMPDLPKKKKMKQTK